MNIDRIYFFQGSTVTGVQKVLYKTDAEHAALEAAEDWQDHDHNTCESTRKEPSSNDLGNEA